MSISSVGLTRRDRAWVDSSFGEPMPPDGMVRHGMPWQGSPSLKPRTLIPERMPRPMSLDSRVTLSNRTSSRARPSLRRFAVGVSASILDLGDPGKKLPGPGKKQEKGGKKIREIPLCEQSIGSGGDRPIQIASFGNTRAGRGVTSYTCKYLLLRALDYRALPRPGEALVREFALHLLPILL